MTKHTQLSLVLTAILLAGSKAGAATVEFNRDIRPILADTCFHCHGPDPGARKASLRLDTEAGFFKERDGKFPVVKGKPDQSSLYQRLITKEEDDVMPPKKEHKDTATQWPNKAPRTSVMYHIVLTDCLCHLKTTPFEKFPFAYQRTSARKTAMCRVMLQKGHCPNED